MGNKIYTWALRLHATPITKEVWHFGILLFMCASFILSGCGTYESSPLIVSIRSEDVYAVRSMIDSGEDVNALSLDLIEGQYWKMTPLIRASVLGNIEIMTMLLEAGADVNGKDEVGDTPLMAAAEFGHINGAKLLIESGANIDSTKPDQTTALMIAVRNGDAKMTNLLVEAGADLNIGFGTGYTALSMAAWDGYTSIAEILIENGAKVDSTALRYARQKNNHEVIRLLEKSGVE